jgi:hypothetical protein
LPAIAAVARAEALLDAAAAAVDEVLRVVHGTTGGPANALAGLLAGIANLPLDIMFVHGVLLVSSDATGCQRARE